MSNDTMTCGRRHDFLAPGAGREGQDSWYERDGIRRCDYCGSLHPDDVFAAIDAGHELTPTDKNYKVYVKLPDPLAGQPRIISLTNDPQDPENWTHVDDLDPALREGRGNTFTHVQLAERTPMTEGKFYFQHFDEEQRRRFVDLLNAKRVNIGYPGHFYRLPFFCTVDERTA